MSLRNYFYRFGKYILTFFLCNTADGSLWSATGAGGYYQGGYLGWFLNSVERAA